VAYKNKEEKYQQQDHWTTASCTVKLKQEYLRRAAGADVSLPATSTRSHDQQLHKDQLENCYLLNFKPPLLFCILHLIFHVLPGKLVTSWRTYRHQYCPLIHLHKSHPYQPSGPPIRGGGGNPDNCRKAQAFGGPMKRIYFLSFLHSLVIFFQV
jgi:hypothetical protein